MIVDEKEKPPRCATCKLLIKPTRGEDVIPAMPGTVCYFHEPQDCISALRTVMDAADALAKAVDKLRLTVEDVDTAPKRGKPTSRLMEALRAYKEKRGAQW